MHAQAEDELVVRAILRRRPEHLAQCRRPRVRHILAMRLIVDIFSPKLALTAEDMPGLPVRQFGRNGLEDICLFHRDMAPDGPRLLLLRALVVVEIGVRGRRHDHVVPGSSGGNPPGLAPPAHHGSPGRQAALDNLVPAEQPPAVPAEERVHLSDEPAMQLGLVLGAQLFFQCIHFLAFRPMARIRFVAADVNIPAGKQLHHLGQDVLHEGDGFRPRRQDPLVGAPPGLRLQRAELVGIQPDPRIGDNRRPRMRGHLDLRHNRHVALRGVSNEMTDLVLGIKSAGPPAAGLAFRLLLPKGRKIHPRSRLRQLRVFLDLDAPALVVGEMNLQPVEFVQGH